MFSLNILIKKIQMTLILYIYIYIYTKFSDEMLLKRKFKNRKIIYLDNNLINCIINYYNTFTF